MDKILKLEVNSMINKEVINSKEDFLLFLKEFYKDFENNKEEWENISAGDYIESIYAWLVDSSFVLEEKKISFNDLKEIFISGKYYE